MAGNAPVKNLSLRHHRDQGDPAAAARLPILYRAAMRGFRIPAWVPVRLHVEYADCAMAHGEICARDHVLRLMRDSGA